MIQIKKFKPEDHKIKALIYGKSWSGKTTLASTAPNPLFICSENWLLSIADKWVDYVEVKNLKDLKEVKKVLNEWVEYDSIVFDSLTEIANAIKEDLTDNNKKSMDMRKRWEYANEMMQTIRDIVRTNYNIISIVHDKKIVDEEGNLALIDISIQWSAKDEIPRYFDVIAYTFVDKDWTMRATANPSDKLITKDRTNTLPGDLPLDITERQKSYKKWVKVWKTKVVKEVSTKPTLEDMYDKYGEKAVVDRFYKWLTTWQTIKELSDKVKWSKLKSNEIATYLEILHWVWDMINEEDSSAQTEKK